MSELTKTERKGAIVTYSGIWFEPLAPDYQDIALEDIAHALSNVCRFTGHVSKFYSVAQHSVLVSGIVPQEDALTGLLHDASEAYLSDFARPIKQLPGFGDTYREVEGRLMDAVALAFPITWPMPESVAKADHILLRTEQRDLMFNDPPEDSEMLDAPIDPWTPEQAKDAFLNRYEELTGKTEYMI